MNLSLLLPILAALLAAALSLWVFTLLRGEVGVIVERVTGVPAVASFFNRVLLIGLLFIAVGATLDGNFGVEANAPALEHVWTIVSVLSSALTGQAVFLFGFLVLVTVLVSVLSRREHG